MVIVTQEQANAITADLEAFVHRVALDKTTTPAEIAALPEVAKVLFCLSPARLEGGKGEMRKEARKVSEWKFEEVAMTEEKWKPTPYNIYSKLRRRFRKWLVARVISSGKWAIYRRPTLMGDVWKLVDQKDGNMEHGSFLAHPFGPDCWLVIR